MRTAAKIKSIQKLQLYLFKKELIFRKFKKKILFHNLMKKMIFWIDNLVINPIKSNSI